MSQTDTTIKKRIPLWPFIVLGVLLLLGGGAWYFYNHYLANSRWKPLLQSKLKELVIKSTDSLYRIEYSDFDLNLASGDATLKNFKLIPDSAVYQKLVAERKAPDALFILGVKQLSIKNVGARKAYSDKILDITDITIDKPDLTIISKRYGFNDTVKVGKPKTPYEIIKKVFKRLRIDSISLNNISLNYINKNEPVTRRTALKNLDIHISSVLIDSLSALDSTRFYYTKGVEVIVNNYKIATPDSLYHAELKRIYFSTAKRQIILDKVNFLPRYDRANFYRKAGGGEMFDLKFKQIAINRIDLQRFLRDQKLHAGVIDIKNAKVKIYANGNYKGKKTSKIGKDPHQALQRVALDMRLDRLNIGDTDIEYSETDANTQRTGLILFKNTDGYFTNVTNDPDVKKINPYMTARIRTRFMNAAPLTVNFKFNLLAKDGAFNYSGTLGKFDGRVLDKLVKPLAMVHVKSADVQRLSFNVNASNYYSKGKLEFYYKNLNVELLKKVEGQKDLQAQGFISKIANALIIVNDNPDKKGNFRPGPISLKREPTWSFFSFLYKGLLDGLKPSVGFSEKTEGTVNKVVAKVSTLVEKFEQFKEKRRIRKEERLRKREEKKLLKAKEEAAEEAAEAKENAEKEKKKAEEKAKKEAEAKSE